MIYEVNIQAKKNSHLFGQLLDKVVDELRLVRGYSVQLVGGFLGDANQYRNAAVVCGPSAIGTGTASLGVCHLTDAVRVNVIHRAGVGEMLLHYYRKLLFALHLLIPDAYMCAYNHAVSNVALYLGILKPLLCGFIILHYLVIFESLQDGVLNLFVTLALVESQILHNSLPMPFGLVMASGPPLLLFVLSGAKVIHLFELCKQKPK